MKNFENLNLGLVELDAREMEELEGGILPFLLAAAAIYLLSSCSNQNNTQVGGHGNHMTNHLSHKQDSSHFNGTLHVSPR
jgi:hypothetical protein